MLGRCGPPTSCCTLHHTGCEAAQPAAICLMLDLLDPEYRGKIRQSMTVAKLPSAFAAWEPSGSAQRRDMSCTWKMCSISMLEGSLRLHVSMQELEWSAGGEPWNPPSSQLVPPNSSYTFGFRLLTAPSIRDRDANLLAAGKVVVHGVPGIYTMPAILCLLCRLNVFACSLIIALHSLCRSWMSPVTAEWGSGYTIATDMDAQLLVTLPEAISHISGIDVVPKGAISIGTPQQARCVRHLAMIQTYHGFHGAEKCMQSPCQCSKILGTATLLHAHPNAFFPADSWQDLVFNKYHLACCLPVDSRPSAQWVVPLKGFHHGRCRVDLKFSDGSSLAVHYFVLPPFKAHVDKFGAFLAGRAWLGSVQGVDPFGRTHSVMPWDRDVQTYVMQDPRSVLP